MTTTASHTGDRTAPPAAYRPAETTVITSARTRASRELSSRVRRYTLAMTFRMACFLAMIVVDGWLRWVLLAVAVFMPYLAVVVANQADQRTAAAVPTIAPEPAPALTTGSIMNTVEGDTIEGEIVDGSGVFDEADSLPRAA